MSARKPQRQRRKKYMGMTGSQIAILIALGSIMCITMGVGAMLILPNLGGKAVAVVTLPPAPTNTPPPSNTPLPTATYTPRPTNTRVVPAQPEVSPTPEVTGTLVTSQTSGLPGTIEVDFWRLEISQAISKPSSEPSLQVVLLVGRLTNQSAQQATFDTNTYLKLRDANGNDYPVDADETQQAITDYQTFTANRIAAGGVITFVVAFITPDSEKSFTLVQGENAPGWSGDISFTLE